MTKAIFETREGSGYNDDAPNQYHFPDRYLTVAQQARGDWIIYREPKRGGGRMGYVAVARVDRIVDDGAIAHHHYAHVTDYLPFDRVVPLRDDGGFFERQLDLVPPARIGAALQGRSVRRISDGEFAAIVLAGLDQTLSPDNAIRLGLDDAHAGLDVAALINAPLAEQQRRVTEILINRKIRDAAFRLAVCDAYDNTCALTGLKIINGGGKSEVQAAHIWSVADGGPDVVQNGLALSGTMHWLFDRHLVSLTDDYGMLVSHNRVPAELRALFDRQLEQIHLPADKSLRPHLAYVRRHREAFLG